MGNESRELAVGRQVLERFDRANAARAVQGERLKAAIRAIIGADVPRMKARIVLERLPSAADLGRANPPSLNRVHRVLREIRGACRRATFE
jgi:hypothetical protein